MSHRFKLLIVEDEPDVCATIQSYFSRRGFTVSTTGSGSEALVLINAVKPDLVLLDNSLYDLNGVEVLRRLRKDDTSTKVVMITGQMHSDEEREEIFALGVNAYRNKPLVLEDLEQLVCEMLGNKPVDRDKAAHSSSRQSKSNNDIVHELSNLLGIIRNKCENFTLNLEDGVYKGKSQEELVKMALEVMKECEETVDRAMKAVEKIPKNPKILDK